MIDEHSSLSERVLGLYEAVLAKPTSARLVAELATQLADSGTRLQPLLGSADLASTGGPTSLTTLLCPLMLAAGGFVVPKVGVAGRPAGGIDVLATIAEYRPRLSALEFKATLERSRYAHVEADSTWAPADAALFLYRQQHGTQANASLATASLLAKKLAAGVELVGLDARIGPHGNFGVNAREGRENAKLYCETANLLGLRPFVFLTNAAVPFQPYVGRGEAIHAIHQVVSGATHKDASETKTAWLGRHASLCAEIVSTMKSSAADPDIARYASSDQDAGDSVAGLQTTLYENLQAQGASTEAWTHRLEQFANERQTNLVVASAGHLEYDLRAIRDILVHLNRPGTRGERDQSPVNTYLDAAGVTLNFPSGTYVEAGQVAMTIRGDSENMSGDGSQLFRTSEVSSAADNELIEVVRG